MFSFKALIKRSKVFSFASLSLGVLNVAFNITILSFINSAVKSEKALFSKYDSIIFITLVVGSFFANKVFQLFIIRLTCDLTYDLESDVLRKLRNSDLSDFERVGTPRIYTAIEDILTVTVLPELLTRAIGSSIIVFGCLCFLLWTSLLGGTIVISVMTALMYYYYYLRNKSIQEDIRKHRESYDLFFRYLNDLLIGFKEVKASSVRTRNIHEDFLLANRTMSKELMYRTKLKLLHNELLGNYSWFLIIGCLLFISSEFLFIERAGVIMFLVTILYMIGSLATLVDLIPNITQVKIALERLDQFGTLTQSLIAQKIVNEYSTKEQSVFFKKIEIRSLSYEYPVNVDREAFEFGPIDLTIMRNEIVFIQGKNGSGKSTFVNLVCEIISPTHGTIDFVTDLLSTSSKSDNSKCFAVIFSTPHLFSENYDHYQLSKDDPRLLEYLKLLRLEDVATIDEKRAIFNRGLSVGQQKRVALVNALLEDKEVLILDEWASQQDPEFRQYFYKTIIPYLKDMGKTILAVTHDESYFGSADRIIKFEKGKIITDVSLINGQKIDAI